MELPYLYRPDAEGRVNIINNVKKGVSQRGVGSAAGWIGFSMKKVQDVQSLIGCGTSLFHKLTNPQAPADEDGLADENFVEDWRNEGEDVWMFSGCADDQTSADRVCKALR